MTCWVLIDTIAIIGSPASRGAVASVGGAGRACLAAASMVSAVSAAIAASVTMAGGPQRRIVTVDCAVVNRFTMLSLVEMPLRACVDQVSDRDFGIAFGITNGRHHPRQFTHANSLLGLSARSGGKSLIYDSLLRRKVARMCVLTLYDDRSPSNGRSQARRLPLHTGNTSGKSTRPARLRSCATVTSSEQSAPSACLAVQSGSDAAWRLG